jgi:hypothetical protein
MRPARISSAIAVLAGWAISGHPVLYAQSAKPTEYHVKAAYLANFVKFTEWPSREGESGAEAFHICVLGQDPFGPVLDAALTGETADGKPMAAKRVASVRDAGGCRVVFISSSEDAQLKTILTALNNSSVLTVGDTPEFVRRGGMIEFVLEGNRVRFEVNLPAARNAGLSLSSQLLKVALTVRRGP